MPRARGERTPVYVTIGSLKYGFQAGANALSHVGELGQSLYTGQPGVVFGANSPKPNRASKMFSGGTVSSYCDRSKESELKLADWTIIRYSRRRGITDTPRSRTVFVEMPGGYNYAWNITRSELVHGSELGFAPATGSTPNLVFGSSPKPPVASKIISGSRNSTFMKPTRAQATAAATANWGIQDRYSLIPEG